MVAWKLENQRGASSPGPGEAQNDNGPLHKLRSRFPYCGFRNADCRFSPPAGHWFLDPVTGQTYTTNRNAGTNGNPDLKPQISTSWNAGVIWTPQAEWLKGFRFNLEYYRIEEEDLIFSPANIQSLVN